MPPATEFQPAFSRDQFYSLMALYEKVLSKRAAFGVLYDLARLVSVYRAQGKKPSRASMTVQQEVAKVANQALALVNRIDGLTPAECRVLDQPRTLGDLMGVGGPTTPLVLLMRLHDAANEVWRRAEAGTLANSAPKRKRGRPQGSPREFFILRVGVILQWREIMVTKYERGQFAKTLRALPPDVFPMPRKEAAILPLIRPVVNEIRRLSRTELGQVYQSALFFVPGPTPQ